MKETLDRLERRFNELMDNHLPHIERRVAKLEGMLTILLIMAATMIGLLVKLTWY